LALKVVLAARVSAPTLIFDEIDTGVGGAVADAIGQRLARLARGLQVLAVTHSPQVASRADHHMLISKMEEAGEGEGRRMITRVTPLTGEGRREEIARMLSGAEVTSEARAQADRLLNSYWIDHHDLGTVVTEHNLCGYDMSDLFGVNPEETEDLDFSEKRDRETAIRRLSKDLNFVLLDASSNAIGTALERLPKSTLRKLYSSIHVPLIKYADKEPSKEDFYSVFSNHISLISGIKSAQQDLRDYLILLDKPYHGRAQPYDTAAPAHDYLKLYARVH
jgi:hypothetical protein